MTQYRDTHGYWAQGQRWDTPIPTPVSFDDLDECDLDCETVEDYCARWRSIAASCSEELQ